MVVNVDDIMSVYDFLVLVIAIKITHFLSKKHLKVLLYIVMTRFKIIPNPRFSKYFFYSCK
jgi:BarA-like signal transduction histidine kinase